MFELSWEERTPTTTRRGRTPVAIWMELPTATPIVNSIFP